MTEPNITNPIHESLPIVQIPQSLSPKDNTVVYELAIPDEPTQLQVINEENQQQQELSAVESLRQERIKKYSTLIPRLAITFKRQLSTIQEVSVSDQSIVASSPYGDTNKEERRANNQNVDYAYSQKERDMRSSKLSFDSNTTGKKLHKKKKKKTKLLSQTSVISNSSVYESSFNFKQYYTDQRVDIGWKMLLSYFTILIISNILLNLFELVQYSQSLCKMNGTNATILYANQFIYIFGKIGIISLLYQEFTNTLPTNSRIPLLHITLFSPVFGVLSMPIYVYDFIECAQSNPQFTLMQALQILETLDLFLIISLALFFFLHSCIKLRIQKKTWKRLKCFIKLIFYLLLLMFHSIHISIIITQCFGEFNPAFILEIFYFLFSIICMIYLSLYKYCCHKQPFEINEKQLL